MSGSATSSSNNPPLNQSTASNPTLPPDGHRTEKVHCQRRELVGPLSRLFQHPGEHVVCEEADILGEHAEHKAVDEMCNRLRRLAALT